MSVVDRGMGFVTAARKWSAARLVAEVMPGAHTRSNRTAFDRYPRLFAAAAAAAGDARRVLSYGCSTGEECVTLGRYFPGAEVVGADINPANVWIAARRFGGCGRRFVYARDERLAALGPFDAIFCLAVLRVGTRTNPAQILKAYPFSRFEDRIRFLDSLLVEGGLLMLHSTTYRFCDCPLSARYRPIPGDYAVADERPSVSPTTGAPIGIYGDKIFRKVAAES